jgi:hypothetical protein
MMGVYIFSVLTTLMLSLLVIVLRLYRSMKLLEKIAAALAVLPPGTAQKPVATTRRRACDEVRCAGIHARTTP